ncbi:MAG: aminopeptidase P family protein [Trueperaceae bacterium]
MASELELKLERVRRSLHQQDMDAVYFTRAGNVSWLLGGGDPVVSLTNAPVAKALVTRDEARLLVPEIERDRLEAEHHVPEGLSVAYLPWEEPAAFDEARRALAEPERTLVDECAPGTRLHDFWQLRVPLLPDEMERYRKLGVDAAEAVGVAMRRLEPGWTEHEIAGEVAKGLRSRGIQPAVLLVGGDGRLKRYRHPVPTSEPVHERVMVVVCGRRDGLYANLSRIAAFTSLGPQETRRYLSVLEIESAALKATRHGRFFRDVFAQLQDAYAQHHHPLAWKHHHQGGPTGYFTRDFLATPGDERVVADCSAYAWNPSLPGLKVEDTVLLARREIEVLTFDSDWPTITVQGIERPDVLLLG